MFARIAKSFGMTARAEALLMSALPEFVTDRAARMGRLGPAKCAKESKRRIFEGGNPENGEIRSGRSDESSAAERIVRDQRRNLCLNLRGHGPMLKRRRSE